MPRVASLLPALVGALLPATLPLVGPVGAPPAAAAEPAPAVEDDAPLALTIDEMSPAVVPRKGPITVSGTVTNTSEETWYAVNVLPFAGELPITSPAELATALETDASVDVGKRVAEPGNFDPVGDLAPGETRSYTVRLRQRFLSIPDDPGVYWFGVHASGETPSQPRDDFTDGRARTFLPQVPRGAGRARLALVAPVRHQVSYAPDGSVADPEALVEALGPDGPLGAAVELGDAASGTPMTWLVDPAVLDAVSALADGNPARDLGPTEDPETQPEEEGDGDAGAGDAVGPTTAPRGATEVSDSGRSVATSWLTSLTAALTGQQRLALPYGDLDLAAAAGIGEEDYRLAVRRSRGRLPGTDLTATPGVAPLDGRLPADALHSVPDGATVLLDQAALPEGPSATTLDGVSLRLASDDAHEGGPGPDDPRAPIALRQRLLAEAAVRLLQGRPQTVVSFAPDELPDVDEEFFSGLDVPWLRLDTLDDLRESAPDRSSADLRYGEELAADQLPAAGFATARRLRSLGATLDDILPLADQVAPRTEAAALVTLSQWNRERPDAARLEADRASAEVSALLDRVSVTGQPVTLSSDQGSFSVTVVNGLEQPIRVRVAATTDPEVQISEPEPLDLAGGAQATRLLDARTRLLGLHQVQLQVTDTDGAPVGPASSMSLRASQVSDVIWVVIVIGLGLMALAIVRRLVLRIVQWRRARGADA